MWILESALKETLLNSFPPISHQPISIVWASVYTEYFQNPLWRISGEMIIHV